VSWLPKRVRQLPFLTFIAPLDGSMAHDIVRSAVRADRGRARSWTRSRTSWFN